jgi:hypothetical protein
MYAYLRRQRPASLLVAVLAVVLALGGTAAAAKMITGKKIKDESVTGKDIKDESLTADDFSGSVQGPQGPAGPQGPQGIAGPADVHYVRSPLFAAAPQATSQIGSANCPADESVVGGGVLPGGDRTMSVNASFPGDNPLGDDSIPSDADTIPDDRWSVYVNNTATSSDEFRVYAICVAASSVR